MPSTAIAATAGINTQRVRRPRPPAAVWAWSSSWDPLFNSFIGLLPIVWLMRWKKRVAWWLNPARTCLHVRSGRREADPQAGTTVRRLPHRGPPDVRPGDPPDDRQSRSRAAPPPDPR